MNESYVFYLEFSKRKWKTSTSHSNQSKTAIRLKQNKPKQQNSLFAFFFIVSADYLNDPIALEREPNEVSIQLSSEMLCFFYKFRKHKYFVDTISSPETDRWTVTWALKRLWPIRGVFIWIRLVEFGTICIITHLSILYGISWIRGGFGSV